MPRIALERHAYAPELNRAHIIRKGRFVASLPCPGVTTIKEARAKLFGRLAHGPSRVGFYDDTGGRSFAGRIASYAQGLAFAHGQALKLVPGGSYTFRTRLVG